MIRKVGVENGNPYTQILRMKIDKATSESNLKRVGQMKNNILESRNPIPGYISQKYPHRGICGPM